MNNGSTRAKRRSGLRALCLAATAVAAMLLCRQRAGAESDDGKASPVTGVAIAWPTYRGNNVRTGSARQTLGTPLFLQWTHVSAHRPRPAWPEPGKEVQRMTFDYAYQPVAAGRRLFYGSSADHQIHAVDLESGKELWRFFTEGPVRFAPCAAAGRVYAASDDGCLYCLDAASGKLLWRFRGGPRDERMIGNEQMISRWPGRSGALVAGKTVYFTAGMWGPDGVYVYALDAEDGSVLWKNDTANFRYMPLPHNNYEGITGVAPQGYLALDEGVLLVPTGRSSPARFDAGTGKWLSWKIDWGKNYRPGCAWTMTCKGVFFTACRHSMGLPESSLGPDSKLHSDGLLAFDLHTGRPVFGVGTAGAAAFDNGVLYLAADSYSGKYPAGVRAVDYGRIPKQRRLPQPNIASHDAAGVSQGTGDAEKWTAPAAHVVELVKAGRAVVAGGYDKVFVLDAETGRRLWETGVDGQARGLAVASGRLLVSTTTGKIYCFGQEKVAAPPVVRAVVEDDRKPKAESGKRKAESGKWRAESGAQEVVEKSGIHAGYCLVLGLDDADLPLEIVRRSDLYVIVLEQDKEIIAIARRRYDALGFYGVRIAVHQGDLMRPPYASYFANLIVVPDPARCDPKSVYRCLRPCGGVLALAGPETETAEKWLARSGTGNISAGDGVAYLERGPLPGAGTWSHPFANPGRTTATGDKYVRLPLKTLWFGGPGPARMVDRHRYSPIPVYANGRLFVSGQDTIIAVDAYNGREMWSRRFEGVGRYPGQYRGPSVVADETCAFVPYGLQCFRLDGDTGRTLVTYNLPQEVDMGKVEAVKVRKEGAATAKLAGSRVEWNYLAVTEGAVVGTVGPSNIRGRLQGWPTAAPRGKYLFALDKASGKTRWVYELEHTVTPSAIVIGGGRVFLLDQKATVWNIEETVLKALDLKTGKVVWSKPIGDKPWELMLSGNHLLVAGKVYTVLDPKTGRQQWSRRVPVDDYAKYGPAVHHYQWAIAHHPYNVVPPLIVGGKIITPPWAYDLETGEPLGRTQPVSGEASLPVGVGNGGCGTYSACPAAMFFRSGALGIYDLENDTGMHWLGQIRPGCWINTLPAGGILLVPEAASSCSCAYSFQTSLALIAAQRQEEWGAYACQLPRQGARVKKVCLNFGAVGDKRDPSGKLWLAFPRPFSPQSLRIPLTTSPKTEAYRENADTIDISGTDRPWLYAGGVKGMETAALDLQLRRPAVVLKAEKAPQIDGVLDDACWNGAEELHLVDDFRRESSARAWLRYDSQNLYIAFRREAALRDGRRLAWTMNTEGDDAPAWQDDSLKVRFDPGDEAGWYLFLSASGARFTGTGDERWRIFSGKDRKTKWKSGTHVTDKAWSAEIAIPFRGPGPGMNIFLESFNRTGVGPERAFYQFRSWRRWFISGGEADLVFKRPTASPERTFRVKLHFAELEDVKPGQRVFDVRLQAKTVIRALDVVKEAGGRCRAITREFSGVKAAETISIGLVPARGSKRPAILSGIEIQEEESR